MKRGSSNRAVLGAGLLLAVLVTPAFGKSGPADPNRYLNAVREFADNVLKYGRDTYGPKHTPLFVDGLNVNTHEPVKWIDPDGTRWVLSDLASQQTLFRTLDGLTTITGDHKYRQAAMDAIKYAFERLQAPSGLLYWGQVAAYDAQADRVYGNQHCLKMDYPYYDLMWRVDPNATRTFIEAFWSTSVLDWSNLDLNRYSAMVGPFTGAWNHEYKGGATFFQGKGLGFLTTGTSLVHAGTDLHRFSGQEQPLLWSKRLIRRYVDTRNPKTGIGAFLYNGRWSSLLVDDLTGGFADPYTTVFPLLPFEEARGMYHPLNQQPLPWISLFLVGDTLGGQGKDFTRWALEEFTAWGKTAYRKKDNSFIPILTDGTSIEGYVCKETIPNLGPKGAVAKPLPADMIFFWAYSTAYRATGDAFMWQMTRDIALGNNAGDIGETPGQMLSLQLDTACSDVFGLLGFLELFRKTKSPAFLEMAQRVGKNILDSQFHKGFFVPSRRHIYTRFDCFEPLALLHLHVAGKPEMDSVPQVWPSSPLFVAPYRQKEQGNDHRYIYTLTESPEPPLSLQEAAAIGDVNLVTSLLEKGVAVDSWDDNSKKTGLQRAARNGHREVVALLLDKGARVDAKDGFPGGTPLHYAAENGHKDTAELLISKGANVNAASTAWGNTPIHPAVAAGHDAVVMLLAAKGADLNVKNSDGFTPLQYAVSKGPLSWWETQIGESSTPNDLAIAQFLLAHGADVNAKSNDGRSAMDIALAENRTEMVELLRKHGAKLTDQIQSLHKAVADHNIAQVKSLLSQGIDVNAKDEAGDTPLHYAARLTKDAGKDVCELLIARGASVNATNKVGWTPLHEAVEFGDLEVVKLLIADGADLNARDSSDRTPLSLADAADHREIVELLNKHIRIPSPAEASFADTTPDLILTPESSIAPQQFGCHVACGDVNGDGYDDCLVTAAHYSNYQGKVYLYYGGPDMDARPDKVFTGEAGELFGEGAALGDVNGDHFTDVIIAAIRYNNKQGRVLIYYGGPDMDTNPDVILDGEPGTSGIFGRVIDTADIDHDGYADVVINALRYGSEAGRAYLYYGGNPMNTVPAKIFDGENPGDMFGREMDMGGDVNADGYGDIIFGCRAWNNWQGRAYLYYGGPRATMDTKCDKTFTGESVRDEFGSSVCLFDVDKDGYADVMVGARKYSKNTPRSYEGRMYMYWGGPDISPNADLIFEGERGVGGCFGGDSIECGYFSDDKYPDIVVSAWGYRTSQGRVCLHYGGPRASMDTVCDHTFTGEMGTEASMYGVRNAVGDFNGDKRSDLLVGAPWYPSGNRLGRAYVYCTKPFPPGRQLNPAK